MSRPTFLPRDLLKALRWHRRLFAALAAATAVYFGLVALTPAPPPTVAVVGAARDLPGGSAPAAADLRTLRLPADAVPSGALRPGTDLSSRVLAAPVRAGEPLTDARFVAPGLVRRSGDGAVAYPIRIDDAEVVALLRVGDRVDILAANSTDSPSAQRVAAGVAVIALPAPARDAATARGSGALVVVSTSPTTAGQIAQAAVNSRLTVALTGKPG